MQYSDSHLLLTRLQKRTITKTKFYFALTDYVCVCVCLFAFVCRWCCYYRGVVQCAWGCFLGYRRERVFFFLRAPFLGGFYLTTTKKNENYLLCVCLSVCAFVQSLNRPSAPAATRTHAPLHHGCCRWKEKKRKKNNFVCLIDKSFGICLELRLLPLVSRRDR